MSEHEPVEENQQTLEDAGKLRDLIRHPGWTDVILPELENYQKMYQEELKTTEWKTLEEMRVCQASLLVVDRFLKFINDIIKQADEITKKEALKMQEGA